MLDMQGTSDSLLNKLAKEGVCREANVLRHWIKKLARAINPLDVRSPPPKGMSHVKAWTADNADYHLFHSCLSVVPVANILLGIEDESDTTHFNKTYINGLGKVSDVQPEELAASEYDDKVAFHGPFSMLGLLYLALLSRFQYIQKLMNSTKFKGWESKICKYCLLVDQECSLDYLTL